MRKSPCIYVLTLCLALVPFPISAQESDLAAEWLVRVNQARLDAALAPYESSGLLTAAAQRHADDVAANGFANSDDPHLGSDGTHEQERVAQAGYVAWTWNGGGTIVDENMSTHDTIEAGMDFFWSSEVHRGNILSSRYREIGIGVAMDGAGGHYHVLVFGVRPNLLPIFINDGAATTDDPNVAIHLTNEEARPDGEGTDRIGRAIEVRISDDLDWDGQPWQSWDDYVPWTLPGTPGEHVVYVQFRDAAGRTTESADTIVFEGEGPVEPTPVPPTFTPEPTATTIPPTDTPEPTATPEPTPVPEPTVTATSAPSPVPSPTVFVPTPSSRPAGPTPFPTWTPLPTLAPSQSSESGSPFGLLGALQGAVVLLGLYLILRRGRGGQPEELPDDE